MKVNLLHWRRGKMLLQHSWVINFVGGRVELPVTYQNIIWKHGA